MLGSYHHKYNTFQVTNCLTGYARDLIDHISNNLNATLKHFLPKNGQWGNYDARTGKVTGMAEYLVTKKADLISALYGVNLQRFQVVDYIIQGDENTNSFSIKSNNFA